MSECGATTRAGTPCKRKRAHGEEQCHIHINMSECAICLNHMINRSERNARTLPCNHKFHTSCINRWKRQGNYTCPICRHDFDIPEYNIIVIIEARRTRERLVTTNLQSSQLVGQHLAETFDLPRDNAIEFVTEIVVEAGSIEEIESSLLGDFRIDPAEINMTTINNAVDPP